MKAQIRVLFLALFGLGLLLSCNQPTNDAESEAAAQQEALEDKMIATNEALFTAWNTGDASIMEANLTEDFSRKENGDQAQNNRKEYIELMQSFRTAIPDMNFTHELVAVEGNKTLTKWTTKGTNTGMFGEQPPTGKSSVTHGFTIISYNDEGKATSEEAYFNPLSYLEAWGYTLTPPTAE